MRLFIAVMITGLCRKVLTDTLGSMKQDGIAGRFVPEENLHITLAFIGEYGSPEPVINALRRVSFHPFEIELNGTGMFGDTLWAGIKDHEGLRALADQVRQELSASGIPYDRKAFVPHITLVRRMKGTQKECHFPACSMTVSRISLLRSDLSSGSPNYIELSSFGNADMPELNHDKMFQQLSDTINENKEGL